jgi:hypothetical protein
MLKVLAVIGAILGLTVPDASTQAVIGQIALGAAAVIPLLRLIVEKTSTDVDNRALTILEQLLGRVSGAATSDAAAAQK